MSFRSTNVVLLSLAPFVLSGCADQPPLEATESRAEPVVVGAERLIPIQAVFVEAFAGQAPASFVGRMERATAIANQMFGATGIQFTLRSATKALAPDLAAWCLPHPTLCPLGDTDLKWGGAGGGPGNQARDDLDQFFGTSVFPSRWSMQEASRSEWLSLGVAAYGRPDALYVVVGSSFPGSSGPPDARVLFMSLNDLAEGSGMFGHELGHWLGLNHPWESGLPFTNPRTQQPLALENYWDLEHRTG